MVWKHISPCTASSVLRGHATAKGCHSVRPDDRSLGDHAHHGDSDFVRGCLFFSSPRPAAPGEPSRPAPPFAAPGRLPLFLHAPEEPASWPAR